MKKLAIALAALGALALSSPVYACPGHDGAKDEAKTADKEKSGDKKKDTAKKNDKKKDEAKKDGDKTAMK